jgi:hypothetical protein
LDRSMIPDREPARLGFRTAALPIPEPAT